MSKKKSLSNKARSLHRDLGYFFIGISLIYAITGFILSARGLGWFKYEYTFQTNISKNISSDDFKEKLISEAKIGKLDYIYKVGSKSTVEKNISRLNFVKQENSTLFFDYKYMHIIYNQTSGETNIKYISYPAFLQMFINSHLSTNNRAWYYLAMVYSIVLAFFALSAIVMVKGKYGFKKRGFLLMLTGIFTVVIFLALSFS
ncbi:hypothetical protein [Arcobacter sp. F2176]|uniref:hypothetical protein n=1 Tax=Arcobacter sp. F2176 TaxID=2044511 RepID=UPI00100BB0AB|nr:hypothetical protein [Arcobacter sp. F2176]RXJ80093.1 hypothetical protein CRU95_12350 [Arcobacter sp. F2176]